MQLDVDWITTGDVIMGRLLSIMSLGYLIVLFFSRAKAGAASAVKAERGR